MLSSTETMTATFTDPSGNVWDLMDPDPNAGFFTRSGVTGWGATPYTLVTDPQSRGGVRLRFARAEPGRLTWPLHIWGDDHLTWLANYRALKSAFTMTVHRGQAGVLRVTRPDGSAREIEVLYEDGFGGEGGAEDQVFSNPVLTLMCPDGYWRGTVPRVESRAYDPGASFLDPFPHVSAAQVLGSSIITNPGDVVAWPDWTISGPATTVNATNITTQQQFTINRPIVTGETITISTGAPSVRGPTGENIVNELNWPISYLWPLLPGDNNVYFAVSGASAPTQIVLSYSPRYEGA